MKKFAVALTALALMSSSAQAADLILDTPDVEYDGAFGDWSGFYAGVVGGYAGGNALAGASDISLGGGLLGVAAGYNHQVDNFVVGAEGELMLSSIGGTAVCANAAFSCTGSLTWLSSLRGRAGVVYDSYMLYGAFGVAAGGVSASTTPAPGGSTGTFSGTAFGWTAGVGVEVAVSETATIKAEYAYYDLRTQAPNFTIANLGPTDIRGQVHAAKLGVNFKF